LDLGIESMNRLTPKGLVIFERRRYGRQTFTWAFVTLPGETERLSLGDPWPCLRPPRKEIDAAVALVIAARSRIEDSK
jgi:hypothetical protein